MTTFIIVSYSSSPPEENLAGEAFKYEFLKYFTTCKEDQFWELISSSKITEEEFTLYAEQTTCEGVLVSNFILKESCEGTQGDIEDNGDVTLSDAKLFYEFILFKDFFPGMACGDFDYDNSINYIDLILLINKVYN